MKTINGKGKAETIDQVLGGTNKGKFLTLDKATYEERIDTMSKNDLREHCIDIGVPANDNREIMRTHCLRAFSQHVSQYNKPTLKHSVDYAKLPDKVKNILRAGK